jgi:teichuronic acid biosynthesis glycosyltransferase TuaG
VVNKVNDLYKNETVSVIIPVYNASKYIGETIESALKQTYKDIEIILVDDCSRDNSRQIIEGYMKIHRNIVYHLQEKNSGAAVARNKALDLAKGRYVAFLDSDDLWYPEKIQKQIDLMKNKQNIAFCYTAYEMVDDEGKLIKEKIKILEKATYKNLLKRTMISTPTVLLDRYLLGDLKMPLRRTGQDYAYWLLLLRNVEFAYGIDEPLVKVRRRGNSLSANKFQNIFDVWTIQTQNENLPPFYVTYNTAWYVINSLLKRYF